MQLDALDRLDYCILAELSDAKLWKKEVYNRVNVDMSVQTVGRRIGDMYEAGYLESGLVEAAGIRRDYIQGFWLSDQGEEALDQAKICTECGTLWPRGNDDPCTAHDWIGFETWYQEQQEDGDNE